MASTIEYVQFVSGQLALAGEISYKKMFGEYGLYCNGKYFGVICDNRFLIKVTKAALELMPNGPMELPYEGGKPMLLIEELDDREFLREIVTATCAQLPEKKPKKKQTQT